MTHLNDLPPKQRAAVIRHLNASPGETVLYAAPSRTTNFAFTVITTDRFAVVRTAWGQIPLTAVRWAGQERVALSAADDVVRWTLDLHPCGGAKVATFTDDAARPAFDALEAALLVARPDLLTWRAWTPDRPVRSALPGHLGAAATDLLRGSTAVLAEVQLAAGLGLVLTDTHLVVATAGLLARPTHRLPLADRPVVTVQAERVGPDGNIIGTVRVACPPDREVTSVNVLIRERDLQALLDALELSGGESRVTLRNPQEVQADWDVAQRQERQQRYALTGVDGIPRRYVPALTAQMNGRPFRAGVALNGPDGCFVVLTDQTLTVTGPGQWGSVFMQTHDLSSVTGLTLNTGALLNTIEVRTTSGKETFPFDWAAEAVLRAFTAEVDALRQAAPADRAGGDVTEALVQLAQLREAGTLTEEEFARAKARVLGS